MVDIAWIKRIIIISDQLNSIQRIILMPITRHMVEQLGMDAIDSLPVAPPTVLARLVELLFCFETCFQNNLVSFLHRSFARMSALTEASLRLHWRSKYLNLALEVFMSSNTSPCLGLLDLIQNLKASLASECAALTKSFHPVQIA